jgi:hypothetical protein
MTDELETQPALAATIEPLPGGLAELRRRLRAPRTRGSLALAPRTRGSLGVALAAACCALLAVWLLRPPLRPAADRTALRRVLVDPADLPHPLAVELGLVDRSRPAVAADPRIAPSDTAVFFWVPPAQR